MKFKKIVHWMRRNGFRNGIIFVCIAIAEKLLSTDNQKVMSHTMGKLINYRRFQLGQNLGFDTNFCVIRGPFSGMNWGAHAMWGSCDLGNQLLGFYEEQITKCLEIFSNEFGFSRLVDIGAGDGYFVTGVLHSKLFTEVIAFEASEPQQQIINKNLISNGINENFILQGIASEGFLSNLEKKGLQDFTKCVFLIDVEGAEFEILSRENLVKMRHSPIVVEIHNYRGKNKEAEEVLIELLRETHSLVKIEMGSRNLDGIPEISSMNDSDRWLMCSEGRPENMEWFILLPHGIPSKEFLKSFHESSSKTGIY